jgi:myo-inositol-1(or 4)-monophosphatase
MSSGFPRPAREAAIHPRDLELRLRAACAVAREAGTLAAQHFSDWRSRSVRFKGPHDYLTETDGQVEALIVERLGALFEGDGFLGEEGGGQAHAHTWVIDPIDGTENFARGIPHFCVSLAFVAEGDVSLGVVYHPLTEELFTASRGGGAAVNGRPMHVRSTSDLRLAAVEVGWSNRRPLPDYLALLGRLGATGAGLRRAGSGTLGLVYVADGRLDAYCELHINAWDALAALLMVREAGGWCNDFLAGEGLTRGNAVLATAPGLKDALIGATGIGA